MGDDRAELRRVIDIFVAYGLPEPVFEVTQGGMAVTVFKEIAKAAVTQIDEGVNGGVNGGVNALLSALLSYLQNHPGKRASELVEPLNTPLRTIERWLKQLKEKDKIEFRGVPKTGGYFIKAKE